MAESEQLSDDELVAADENVEDPDRLAEAIYGTIVIAGVLTASWADDEPSATVAMVYSVATVVVFWLAHGWARTLAYKAARGTPSEWRFRHSLRMDFPMVRSAVIPTTVVGVLFALGATDENSIEAGVWTCVGLLGARGGLTAHRDKASWPVVIGTGLGCAALGLVMILLKNFVH